MLGRPWTRLDVQVAAVVLISIVVTGAVAYWRVSRGVEAHAQAEFENRIERSATATTDQLAALAELNRTGATVLAGGPFLAGAVARRDRMAALSVVTAMRANTPLAIPGVGQAGITFYDANGDVLLRTHLPFDRQPGASPPMVQAVLRTRGAISGVREDDRLGPVVTGMAPIVVDGQMVGVLEVMGTLDRAFAQAMSRVTDTNVALVQDGVPPSSSDPSMALSSVDVRDALQRVARGDTAPYRLALSGATHLGRVVALGLPGDAPVGAVLLTVSETELMQDVQAARWDVIQGLIPGLLVGLLLASGLVALLTRPLRSLTLAAQRIQRNDLSVPVRASGPRELRTLATTLDAARMAIRDANDELSRLARGMSQLAERSSASLSEATQELSVLHAVVAHLSGPTHGGLPAAIEELTRLPWVDGAFVALADASEQLRLAAESSVALTAIEEVLDLLRREPGSIRAGLFLNDTGGSTARRLAEQGVAGLAVVPLDASDGIAGVLAVTTAHPAPLSAGRTALLRSIAHEIAATVERADLAGEMEQSRMLATSVLRDISEGVVVFDEDGRCRVCNPSAGALLGVHPDDALGATASAWLPLGAELLDVLQQRVLRGEASTAPLYAEVHGRPLAITVGAFREPGAERPGMVLLLRDLAEQTEAERIKQDFVSMVGHELRTPLTLIQSSVDLLGDGSIGTLTATQRRLLDMLQQNSARLLTLINDLLDLSALDTGRVEVAPQSINLTGVAAGVIEEHRAAAAAKQLLLAVEHDEARVDAWADRDRVRQVLSNLLSNAIKYTPEGGHVRVAVRTRDDRTAEVAVADDGIGIPPGEQAPLFERFYRTRAGRRLSGGTGLGLAIARSIVELHGGMIWCESDGQRGSTFTFTLPRHQPAEA